MSMTIVEVWCLIRCYCCCVKHYPTWLIISQCKLFICCVGCCSSPCYPPSIVCPHNSPSSASTLKMLRISVRALNLSTPTLQQVMWRTYRWPEHKWFLCSITTIALSSRTCSPSSTGCSSQVDRCQSTLTIFGLPILLSLLNTPISKTNLVIHSPFGLLALATKPSCTSTRDRRTTWLSLPRYSDRMDPQVLLKSKTPTASCSKCWLHKNWTKQPKMKDCSTSTTAGLSLRRHILTQTASTPSGDSSQRQWPKMVLSSSQQCNLTTIPISWHSTTLKRTRLNGVCKQPGVTRPSVFNRSLSTSLCASQD